MSEVALPVPVRGLVDAPLATWSAATQPRHVGLGPRFIDEDLPVRVEPGLLLTPLFTTRRDI